MSTKAAVFRKKFMEAAKPLQIVGAHDGLGAQLIEKHGFDGVWASGLEISASHGVPDANILTMTQCLERSQEMHMASGMPVIADVDTGYGNSSNVDYMVRQYEAAGIACVIIEDKLFPKVNSFVPGRQELAGIPEFCGKLEAAVAARTTQDFLIVARVEALIAGWGMEEALKRAHAYTAAGADAILIHSKSKKPDEIREFLHAWKKKSPIVLVPTTYPDLTYDEMATLGVQMIIYANQGLRACISAMHSVLEIIKTENSTVRVEDKIAPVKEIFELQGMMAMKEHEKKYLRMGKTVHAVIPAAGVPQHEGKMAELLTERPVAMLDIEGKPLVSRIVEHLNLAGIQDVTVVTGYKGDMVTVEGGQKRQLKNVEGTGILHSVEEAKDVLNDSVLIHYGDVLVSPENIKQFIRLDAPAAIMVSPLLREGLYAQKQFDLVTLEHPPTADQLRTLEPHPRNFLVAIGKDIPPEKAHAEFVGLLLLNPDGVRAWKEIVHGLSAEEHKTFSLCDVINRLCPVVPVTTFETRTGWAEVHSMDDYERLCALFRSND